MEIENELSREINGERFSAAPLVILWRRREESRARQTNGDGVAETAHGIGQLARIS